MFFLGGRGEGDLGHTWKETIVELKELDWRTVNMYESQMLDIQGMKHASWKTKTDNSFYQLLTSVDAGLATMPASKVAPTLPMLLEAELFVASP